MDVDGNVVVRPAGFPNRFDLSYGIRRSSRVTSRLYGLEEKGSNLQPVYPFATSSLVRFASASGVLCDSLNPAVRIHPELFVDLAAE